MNFHSDNAAAVCPEVLAAIAAANPITDGSYDGDRISARLDDVFGDFFGTDCRVFAVGSGTAANALGLAAIVPPWGAIVCHREAHIEVDECGAPEFFSGGAKLILAEGEGAKLTVDSVARSVADMRGDVHQVQVGALSLTQATECGRAYAPDEIAALSAEAKRRGWRVQMDGARFSNAVRHLGCHPAEVTWRAGIDVLSFGFIKNGGMSAEALVFFDAELAATVPYRKKRAGQMPSKGRFAAAQLIAMLESGAWASNADAANSGAQRIAAAVPSRVLHAVEANEVFLKLGTDGAATLRAKGFGFYDWGDPANGEARFVVAWDQPQHEIEALSAAIVAL